MLFLIESSFRLQAQGPEFGMSASEGDGRMDFMRRISFPTWPCPTVVGKVWRELRRQPRTSSSCPPVPARPRCRCIWRGRPSLEGSLGRRLRRCLLRWVSQGFRPKTLKEDKVIAIIDLIDVQRLNFCTILMSQQFCKSLMYLQFWRISHFHTT